MPGQDGSCESEDRGDFVMLLLEMAARPVYEKEKPV